MSVSKQNRARRPPRKVGWPSPRWLLAIFITLGACVFSPLLERVARSALEHRLHAVAHGPSAIRRPERVSLRVERLGPLLSSWETIGGCGAGTSSGAGVGVKWIGRSTRGGLFNAQFMASYLSFDEGQNYTSGYNLLLTTQLTRDLSEDWNAGVVVPFLYKYYRDYFDLDPPVDMSNGGFGDINLLLTRRFGPINATALTLSVGLPTGTSDATFRKDLLSQEKQLGLGRVTGGLTLDHTFDEVWGLMVAGASFNYRGGQNELGSYRAPMASAYWYGGYFLGPFVPSLGLSFTRAFGADKDRGLEQETALNIAAANAALEWSNDYVAVLAGGSLPYSLFEFEQQPWVVALGFSVSPF
ncbi:MAG: hypothetical protein M3020_24505 [Myxococcota bacterium]|nr:hypothetical protein [Myxococcota bacterium]